LYGLRRIVRTVRFERHISVVEEG